MRRETLDPILNQCVAAYMLPAPVEEDLSKGILERIDMDSYRVEKRAMQKTILKDEDTEIDPVPGVGEGGNGEVEIDRLSVIIGQFKDLFWTSIGPTPTGSAR